jgi:hypothetical protein
MLLDETYIWGRPGSTLDAIGRLRAIYRISDELYHQCLALARMALKKAYKKTQDKVLSEPKLRALFDPVFVERLLDWDKLVKGHLRTKANTAANQRWKQKGREMLVEKAYEESEIAAHLEAIENNEAFLERHSFLY